MKGRLFKIVWILFSSVIAAAQSPSEALTLQSRGDWEGAEKVWRSLVQSSPKDYRYWTSLGACLAHQNRFAEAIDNYRKALTISPSDGQTNFNLGLAYFKTGNLQGATGPLKIAAKVMPQAQEQIHVLLGMSYFGIRKYQEAIPQLEAAQKEAGNNPELQLILAKSYLLAKEFGKAKQQFQTMLERNPDSAQVHLLLGEAYDGLGKQDSALQEFRAAAGGGTVPDAHFGVGYLLWRDKHYDEAATEFRQELTVTPRHQLALAYLGDSLLRQGNQPEAEKAIQDSVSVKDDQWITHYDLGIIAASKKDYAAAIAQYKLALSFNNNRPDVHYHLAQVYKAVNRNAEAQAELKIVSTLHEQRNEDIASKLTSTSPD